MPTLSWTAPARADLSRIRHHLETSAGAAAALSALRLIRARADILLSFPRLGPTFDAEASYRSLAVRGTAYVIAYRVDEAKVEVLRVLHERQLRVGIE